MTIEDPGLLQFAQNLAQENIGEASLEEAESFRAESFTSYILEMLEEEGETEDWSIGYLRKRGIEVAAFGFPEGEQRVAVPVADRRVGDEVALKRSEGFRVCRSVVAAGHVGES